MIHVFYSNRMEDLVAALARDLEKARRAPPAGLFETAHLVVPNRNVEAYVRLELARRTRIVANLRVRLLERFLADLVDPARRRVRIVDGAALLGLLLDVLHDDAALAGEDLATVRAYLDAGADEGARDLRRYQLAAQFARLFEEYAYSRAEMLAAWRGGESTLAGHHATTERAQRALWLRLFGDGGAVDRRAKATGAQWLTLPELFGPRSPIAAGEVALPDRVHVLGFSYVATAFQRILASLAARTDLRVYALNPCLEYWEDVPSVRERDAARMGDGDDPFGLEQGDTPALRLWGRPGRENIRLLNTLTECDFEDGFAEPLAEGDSLLHRLQHDILRRTNDAADGPSDESITLFACPGVRREAEAIAAEIWRLVEGRAGDSRPLAFNEVAVLVAGRDPDVYLAHLSSVFRESHGIPHHVVDLPLGKSRLVEAVELLLELPQSAFTRQDLLRLITHPSVLARQGDADADEWMAWVDRLDVVHGADRADHAQTYIRRELYHWDQALRRLVLGAFMAGAPSGEERFFEIDGGAWLPEEIGDSQIASAGRLGSLVRSLVAEARALREARLDVGEWIARLSRLVGDYVGITAPDEERDRLRVLRALADLERIPVQGRVSYRVASQLALAQLAGLTAARGHYLADGVVVSSFLPMRALPFRVVFVAGLGEGRFPAPERKNHLDLRHAHRRAGDVSAREQDKYLFLETVLGARERLYLSWVAREPHTGEEQQPSAVVLELQQMLDGKARLVKHPLRRWAPPDPALPEARREAEARALGESLRDAAGTSVLPGPRQLASLLPEGVWGALAGRLRLVEPPAASLLDERGADAVLRVPVSALRKFLECPLQGYARFWLRLEEDDEDLMSREDEPFATTILDQAILLREVFVEARRRGVDPRVVYDQRAERAELCGALPTGLFGEVERERQRAILERWEGQAQRLGGVGRATIYRFGGAEEHAVVDAPLDPVRLELTLDGVPGLPSRLKVDLVGKTEPVTAAGSLLLVLRRSADGAQHRAQKDALRGFLDHAMLAASGISDGKPHAALVCTAGEEAGPTRVGLRPLGKEEARQWLATLTADLLGRAHDYLLPCEAVLQRGARPSEAVAPFVEKVRKSGRMSSVYGPVRHPELFDAPPEAEARAMIERRFGPFFARREA